MYYKIINQGTKHEVFRSKSVDICNNYIIAANNKWKDRARFGFKADDKGRVVTEEI